MTIDRERAVATATEVLARYEVPADRSPGLRALAGGKQVAAVAEAVDTGRPVPAEGR